MISLDDLGTVARTRLAKTLCDAYQITFSA